MTLVEDDDVIQKLSAKATDHASHIRILPRRSRRGGHDKKANCDEFFNVLIEKRPPCCRELMTQGGVLRLQ